MSNIAPVDPQTQREVLASWEAQRIHELEAENARLRWLLRVHTLAEKLHLSPSEAHTMVVLYDAPRPMSVPDILAGIPVAWRGKTSNVASMNVHRIREKLGFDAIGTAPAGYRLSEPTRARVQIVLEDAP